MGISDGLAFESMNRRREPGASGLSEAAQSYLLTVRSIVGSGQPLTVSALAARMHVSKQAASEMTARLVADGLLETGGRDLALSAPGQRVADEIFRRHALLEWLLTKVVGLGWAESDEEAMRIQSVVSPRVEAAIRELVGDPPTCPHGNPIDAETARRRPAGIPLSDAVPGTEVTIYRITEEAEEEADLLRYLDEQGLVPGVVARVVEVSTSRDAVLLEGPSGRSSLGLRPASLIRVLAGQAEASLFHRIPTRQIG
jgi:DtxR family Mn-dependent transcriptional regulator